MEWWLAPWLQDPDLQARLRELRGRIEGCVCAKSIMGFQENSKWEYRIIRPYGRRLSATCPKPESDNHTQAFEDIMHVLNSFLYLEKTSFVCLTSGCKSSHENEGPRKKGSMESSQTEAMNKI